MSNEDQTVLETGQVDGDEQIAGDAGDSQTGENEQANETAQTGQGAAEESDDLIVTIEGEQKEDEEAAPNWVKELRRKNREDAKKLRQLEEELARVKGGAPVDKPPTKPTLEQFDYDAEAFEKAMDDYYTKKSEQDKKQAAIKAQQEEQAKEWESVTKTYAEGKARFQKEKMQEAEDEVVSVLNPARQAMLLDAADDSAQLVIALGSNPEVLRRIASIKSDAKFIKELTKVEMNIKVQPKKTPPPPERTISGSGRTPGAAASNLDKLREDAQKSGDYSKYLAEKRRLGK